MKLTPAKPRWFPYPHADGVEFHLNLFPAPITGEDETIMGCYNRLSRMCSGWRGLEDDDGKELEYNETNKINFLMSEEGKEMYWWMISVTTHIEAFTNFEDLKKKFTNSSNGASRSLKPANNTA